MSDEEKKRDRAMQRRVRERMAKTGESYQAAWRQLTGTEAPAEEPAPDPAEEGTKAPRLLLRPVQLPNAISQLKEIVQARRTSHEQIDEPALGLSYVPRAVLPLHHPHVTPHQPTRVTYRPKQGAVDVNRIIISSAGTEGGAGDWIVNDIEVDGRSQLAVKDLSGALFGYRGVAANRKASTGFSISGFDTVEYDHEFAIVVTYVGPNPEGVPFFASAMGVAPPQRPTVVPISSSAAIPPMTKKTITARVQNAPFQVHQLEIVDDAADWIVDDLRVSGRTQFVQSGAIPGDMFSTSAIDSFITLEACEAGGTIEVDVSYVGLNEDGARFAARLEGIVVRDDYGVAPPDLRVVVETSGQNSVDVIGRCNWRSPPQSRESVP